MADETDEISLVDLVKSIIRRRVLFFVTFGLIVLVGVAVALFKPKTNTYTYTYTAIYALASNNMGKPLQNPAAVLAMLQTVYLPEQMERYAKASGENGLPFKIAASNPASTPLIVLQAHSSISHSTAVKAIQNATLRQLEADDGQVLLQRKKELTAQMDSLKAQLDVLKGHSGNSLAIVSALQNMADDQQRLSYLTHGQIIALAKRSTEPTSIHPTHRALIVVIALVLGVLIALLAVFVAELATAVKESSK